MNIGSFSRDEIAAFCQDFLDTFRTCHALSFAVLGLDTRNTDKVMASASSASAFASRSDSTMTYIRATWQDPSADTEVESALDLFGRKWRSKVRDGPTAYPAFCIPGKSHQTLSISHSGSSFVVCIQARLLLKKSGARIISVCETSSANWTLMTTSVSITR